MSNRRGSSNHLVSLNYRAYCRLLRSGRTPWKDTPVPVVPTLGTAIQQVLHTREPCAIGRQPQNLGTAKDFRTIAARGIPKRLQHAALDQLSNIWGPDADEHRRLFRSQDVREPAELEQFFVLKQNLTHTG